MASVPYIGEMLSVTAAILWAFAIVLFKRSGETVHPVALNTFKDVLAVILYVPTLAIAGVSLIQNYPASDYVLLLVSGVIGIAVGDTLLFKSLNTIGAGASALVSCLYSPFIIGLSFVWIGERLTWLQLVGVVLIISAVLETTRTGDREISDVRRNLFGVAWGILAVAAMAVGVVMIKPLLDEAPVLWVLQIRLIGGVAALLLFLAINPARGRILSTLLIRKSRGYTFVSSVIGGYVAMLIWLGGIKFTKASIAAALNQTNTVFVLVFAALILRERITAGRIIAILLAVTGALLVTFG
ncbi:MAG: DMT family transporter [Candidatus Krumholzibacteria bacterium]|nr:DMT family transporter [Candidatus Krumholzibacteria bacterium]